MARTFQIRTVFLDKMLTKCLLLRGALEMQTATCKYARHGNYG